MVEQSPEKACVGGSIPSLATTYKVIFQLDIYGENLLKKHCCGFIHNKLISYGKLK
jgi:hypothetical protein